jgi:hypothetical protein
MGFNKWVIGALGTLLVLAAQISPEQATSNLSAWVQFFGIDKTPSFLETPSADTWAMTIGFMLIIIVIVSVFLNKLSNRVNEKKYISLSEASQSIYSDLREFDSSHFHIIIGEKFRNKDSGVLGYFAVVIANSGEVFGKRPPSTKLEKITRSELSRGTFENNVSEFIRYSGDMPKFTELAVQCESLPKILEDIKTNKALNEL